MLKGPYVSSSQHIPSLVAYFDFGFTAGEFNGSSISVFSRNPISNTERELAVVGRGGDISLSDEIWVPEILPLFPALLAIPFYILQSLRKNVSVDLEFEIGNLESRKVLYGLTFFFFPVSLKTTVLETAIIIVGD
ncbi:hypothetical protein Peur_068682 [Populus x canadensis]